MSKPVGRSFSLREPSCPATQACIGKYCGEQCDGWSVWTRKTQRCDRHACAACDVAVHPGLDFARRDGRPRLAVRFEPYNVHQDVHTQTHAVQCVCDRDIQKRP